MFDLSGKTALITGATGGIGAAIAKALHASGAIVALSGTRQNLLDELKSALGERSHVIACNLYDPAQVEKLVPAAEEAMGSLDILINNAGITRDGLALRMKDEDWNSVIDVNLTVTFRLARAAMRGMMRRRWGRIIGISSISAVIGNPGQANYCAAKAGMIGMTKALAFELAGRNITANCVAPGFIDTSMTDGLSEKVKESFIGRIPVGRLGTAEEVAAAVLYLASPEAAFTTGETINVNGGMAMI
jgi:3-oxoacyl-[acyl-carrier protein] reductase